jgi:hypothetical protein
MTPLPTLPVGIAPPELEALAADAEALDAETAAAEEAALMADPAEAPAAEVMLAMEAETLMTRPRPREESRS